MEGIAQDLEQKNLALETKLSENHLVTKGLREELLNHALQTNSL